jgi:hypothetical protein
MALRPVDGFLSLLRRLPKPRDWLYGRPEAAWGGLRRADRAIKPWPGAGRGQGLVQAALFQAFARSQGFFALALGLVTASLAQNSARGL